MPFTNDCPNCGVAVTTKDVYVVVICPGCGERLYVHGDEYYDEEKDDWPFKTWLVSYDPTEHGDAKEVPPI